ncbi:hypothetical protein LTR56_027809 [Elasticomyces elasticus]|nr:hypothetical protein LTR56_027809 [Elasticomyces elasticus]
MGGHNVVMATGPATDMGITGGGAVPRPESRDVRLGDVVVGVPDREGRHGGVIQYDYGKVKQDGEFRPIGSLNRPHETLLNAISFVQSRGLSSTSSYEYLDAYRSADIVLAEDADYERPDEDVLSKATYHHHVLGSHSGRSGWMPRWMSGFISPHPALGEAQGTCMTAGCDWKKTVTRSTRKTERPMVHYGAIASGSKVVKV